MVRFNRSTRLRPPRRDPGRFSSRFGWRSEGGRREENQVPARLSSYRRVQGPISASRYVPLRVVRDDAGGKAGECEMLMAGRWRCLDGDTTGQRESRKILWRLCRSQPRRPNWVIVVFRDATRRELAMAMAMVMKRMMMKKKMKKKKSMMMKRR